jgi:hypothetical protein
MSLNSKLNEVLLALLHDHRFCLHLRWPEAQRSGNFCQQISSNCIFALTHAQPFGTPPGPGGGGSCLQAEVGVSSLPN